MPLKTTTIGAWPKPSGFELRDWFMNNHADHNPANYTEQATKIDAEKMLQVLKDTIRAQKELGIDVITDGEVTRDTYINHFCRQLEGIDCDNPEAIEYRNGALKAVLPVIRGKIQRRPLISPCQSVREWRQAQDLAGDTPVKYTLPGPLTICGTTKNSYYKSSEEAAGDCARCIREELQELVAAGCRQVQIDEPLLMREPSKAREYGFRLLSEILEDFTEKLHTTIHLCCGYPVHLDQEDYLKADNSLYEDLASFLNESKFNAISIEDAHQRIADLGSLLRRLDKKQIVLGSVAVARSRVESVSELVTRLREALQYVPPERLIVAPDCGLGFLPSDVLQAKMRNLVAAASQLP